MMFSKKRNSNPSSPTSPSKKLQRSVHNQTSPSLKSKHTLKLRRYSLVDPLTTLAIIDQCGSQSNYITHLDISYSITSSTTLKHLCSGLCEIQTLIAVECSLSYIDEDTPWPAYLQSIDFSRNRLTSLPQSLSCLLELTELNLSGNLITELDSKLLALPKLQKIHLLNNPIQNVPKSICREGVKHLREYFHVIPPRLPSPEKMYELGEKHMDLRRYALHNQGSVDSGYESHRKVSCCSTSLSSFSDIESIDSLEEEWPQFEPDTLPDGYNKKVLSSFCQVHLPDGCDFEITVEIVKDISLHPKTKPNELLISPVVQISPHGAQFSESKPAIVILNHCTKPTTTSQTNILPLCSNTELDQCPHWEKLSTENPPKIFQDCIMFSTTHFSLFAVIASIPYPSKSIIVSPEEQSLLVMQELPGFRIHIPQDSVPTPVTMNATVYFSDPPYAIESLDSGAASACIGVEPHGIQFELPVTVSLPIPHFNEIKELLPNATLQIYHSSCNENNSLQWELAQNQLHNISTENDTTIATFETTHFSLFEFVWTVGQDALNKIGLGASNAYKYLTSRKQFVSVRWQAFMTPPLSNLSFGLAVCVYKFGEPLQELSNYPWLVGDSGPKRVYLRVGELKVSLQGHFTANQDMDESLEHSTTVVDFKGDDFCARMDFALRLSLCDGIALPLKDGLILGKLAFTQMDGDRPIVMSYNLIKPNESSSLTHTLVASSPNTTNNTAVCSPNPAITGLTPPWSPDTDIKMDCDDVFVDPASSTATSPSPTILPLSMHRKHQRQHSVGSGTPPVSRQAKRRLFLRIDDISDKTLMDISHAACSKYIELGLQLNLSYNVIHSKVGTVGTTKPEHLKMFHVLQEWKGRAASDFTFEVLSKALEEVGLAGVAQDYCYTNH